jgi:hypothetical protein
MSDVLFRLGSVAVSVAVGLGWGWVSGRVFSRPVNVPPCVFRENGFRCCVNPPRQISRVEPDLSGLPPLAPPEESP